MLSFFLKSGMRTETLQDLTFFSTSSSSPISIVILGKKKQSALLLYKLTLLDKTILRKDKNSFLISFWEEWHYLGRTTSPARWKQLHTLRIFSIYWYHSFHTRTLILLRAIFDSLCCPKSDSIKRVRNLNLGSLVTFNLFYRKRWLPNCTSTYDDFDEGLKM